MFVSLDIVKNSISGGGYEEEFYAATVILAVKRHGADGWITKQYDIETVAQIWTLMEQFTKNKTRTYLICNNSNSTLTLLDVFQTGPRLGWNLTQIVIHCPPCIVRLRKNKRFKRSRGQHVPDVHGMVEVSKK